MSNRVDIDVDFSQLEKVQDRIVQFVAESHGKGVPKNIVRNAARAMAKVVEDEVRDTVPTGKTGKMKESVTKKIMATAFRDNFLKVGNSREYYFVGYKKSIAWYAYLVENRMDGTGGWRKGHGGFPGYKILTNAAKNKADEARRVFSEKLNKDMLRVADKLEKLGF